MEDLQDRIVYSDRYHDDEYEYRHVILPKELACKVPKDRLMSEAEWRALGVQQSLGWVHYWCATCTILFFLLFISSSSSFPFFILIFQKDKCVCAFVYISTRYFRRRSST